MHIRHSLRASRRGWNFAYNVNTNGICALKIILDLILDFLNVVGTSRLFTVTAFEVS